MSWAQRYTNLAATHGGRRLYALHLYDRQLKNTSLFSRRVMRSHMTPVRSEVIITPIVQFKEGMNILEGLATHTEKIIIIVKYDTLISTCQFN